MDFYVHMARPGRRVTQRKKQRARGIGVKHKTKREDAMKWFRPTKWFPMILVRSDSVVIGSEAAYFAFWEPVCIISVPTS